MGLGLLTTARTAAGAQQAGEVQKLVGEARATTTGQSRPLGPHDIVLIDDMIRTEAKAQLDLLLGERTRLKLGEQTQIRIDRYLIDAGGEITLLDGAIEFERTGKKADDDLVIRSDYGLIAVRGTRFYAGRLRGKFSVLVEQGTVDVTAGGRTARIGARQGIDIAAPGAAPSIPATWPLSRVRDFVKLFN